MRYADVRPLSPQNEAVFRCEDLRKYLKLNPFIDCIGGHSVVPYSDLENVNKDIKYFTVLRDPIKRYLSQYEYTIHNRGRKMTFEQFLDWDALCNLQTTKIAGVADANKAIEILKSKFLVVGVVDQFDLFLATLRQAITTESLDISYDEKNIGIKEKRGELYEEYKERIRGNNNQDILLYDYCKNVLIPDQTRRIFGDGSEILGPVNSGSTFLSEVKSYSDYLLRKFYLEPATGLIRKSAGLPSKGSY